MKESFRLSKSFKTAIIIYILSIFQTNVFHYLHECIITFEHNVIFAEVLLFIINMIIGIIIVYNSVNKYLKSNHKKANLIVLIVMLYGLFAIYETPGLYIFVSTGQSGGILSDFHDPYPTYLASLYITIQYAVIILVSYLFNHTSSDDQQN